VGNSAYTYLSSDDDDDDGKRQGMAGQCSAGHKRKEYSVLIRLHTVHSKK